MSIKCWNLIIERCKVYLFLQLLWRKLLNKKSSSYLHTGTGRISVTFKQSMWRKIIQLSNYDIRNPRLIKVRMHIYIYNMTSYLLFFFLTYYISSRPLNFSHYFRVQLVISSSELELTYIISALRPPHFKVEALSHVYSSCHIWIPAKLQNLSRIMLSWSQGCHGFLSPPTDGFSGS